MEESVTCFLSNKQGKSTSSEFKKKKKEKTHYQKKIKQQNKKTKEGFFICSCWESKCRKHFNHAGVTKMASGGFLTTQFKYTYSM